MVSTVVELGILGDRRIDEEGHRQLGDFARLQRLVGEAEAGDLVEIGARPRPGVTLKAAVPVVVPAACGSRRGTIDLADLADLHLHLALERPEAPAEPVADIGVEADGDDAVERLGRRGASRAGVVPP